MTRLHLTYAEEGHPVPARQVRDERGERGDPNNPGRLDWTGQSKSFVVLCKEDCEEDAIKVWSRILLLLTGPVFPAL